MQGTLVGRHRVVKQATLRIEDAQLEVTLCHGRLDRQACRAKVGSRSSGRGQARVGLQAGAGPEVKLPGCRKAEVVVRSDRAGRRTASAIGSADAGGNRSRWIARCIGGVGQRECLTIACSSNPDVGVGAVGGVDQRVKAGVTVDRPPLAAHLPVTGFGGLPLAESPCLVIGGGNIDLRSLVIRRQAAAAQQQCQDASERHCAAAWAAPHHDVSPAGSGSRRRQALKVIRRQRSR